MTITALDRDALPEPGFLIGGKMSRETSEALFPHHYPGTGELTYEVPLAGPAEVDAAVKAAKQAFPAWKEMPGNERRQLMFKYAAAIREHTDELRRLITAENGVTYIGAQGLAVQLKVALNMTLVIEVIGFCEGVALAEKGGVPREVAVDAMLKSVVASPVIAYRAPLILEGHISDATYGDVDLQQKDMLLALDLGRKMGVPVPLGAAANEMLNACRGLGLAHHDFVTVYEVYRRLGGMSK